MNVCLYAFRCIYIYVCVCVHVLCRPMCVYMYHCMLYVCIYVFMCMYVRIHVYVCICIYVYSHVHTAVHHHHLQAQTSTPPRHQIYIYIYITVSALCTGFPVRSADANSALKPPISERFRNQAVDENLHKMLFSTSQNAQLHILAQMGDIIKIDVQETGLGDVHWIDVGQHRDRWRAVATTTVVTLPVS